jgi:hypothetical protein
VLAGLAMIRAGRRLPTVVASGQGPAADSRDRNVAWLVNAQDCQWAEAEAEMPGRDMRVGKLLRLRRGLAEIEFEQGAKVILQGPAEFVLVSGSEARLRQGTLTAHVPERAKGFTILSPQGRVVDLGTEFGLSVDDRGETTVRVFNGLVEAFPLASDSGPVAHKSVTISRDQTARIEREIVAVEPEAKDVPFVRSIKPPPVMSQRTLQLDFRRSVAGSILDSAGHGIGLTHRLPGTGAALPLRDPNLLLDPEHSALRLTTTRSDLNTQDRMPTGEYLGIRLADLGFTGKEDFEISTTMPKIPGLKVVGQFGLYTGVNSSTSIRGGLISQDAPDHYGLFLVKNFQGLDSDLNELGLMNTGDDLRLTLRRIHGLYSLLVENRTNHSTSTLTINHPAFLDNQRDLYAGIFGANTQSDVSKTLTITELKVTIWSEQSAERDSPPAKNTP